MTDRPDPPDETTILALLMRHAMGSAVPRVPDTPHLLAWIQSFVAREDIEKWLRSMLSRQDLANQDLEVTAIVAMAGGTAMRAMSVSGTATATPPPPYPADLVKAPAFKTPQAQFRTLVIVLVFVLAIIGPVVEQHLSARAQSLTNDEMGAICVALGFMAILTARK